MQAQRTNNPRIALRCEGFHILLTEPQVAEIGDISVDRLVGRVGGDYGFDVVPSRESLIRQVISHPAGSDGCGPSVGGVIRVPNCGMADIIVRQALNRGTSVTVSGELIDLPRPISKVVEYPVPDRFIRERRCGTIECKSELVAEVLTHLVRQYPTTLIGVLTSKKQQTERLAFELRGQTSSAIADQVHLCDSTGFHGGRLRGDPTGVAFSTFDGWPALQRLEPPILFLLNEHECVHTATSALEDMSLGSRLLTFREPNKQRAPYVVANAMRMFGPSVWRIETFGRLARPVYLDWRKSGTRLRSTRDSRQAVWFNRRRNAAIVEAAGEIERAKPCVILVNNILHFRELAKQLPDWRLCARDNSEVARLPSSIRRRVNNSGNASWQQLSVLAMTDSTQQVNGYEYDQLIWAAGGPVASIPHNWKFRKHDSEARPLTIIEFDDSQVRSASKGYSSPVTTGTRPKAIQLSTLRKRAYDAAEIYTLGTCIETKRIDKFLAIHGASK